MRIIISVGLLLGLMVAGCGFSLRGTAIPLPPRYAKTYFDNEVPRDGGLQQRIKKLLVLSGSKLVAREVAEVSVHVSDVDTTSKQIVLAGDGTTKEYERTYSVVVSVVDLTNDVQLGSRSLSTTHNVLLDDRYVLAGEDESSATKKEAERILSRQVLRYLKTL